MSRMVLNRVDLMNGQFLFNQNVTFDEVIALAKEFREGRESENIKLLLVRKRDEGRHAIMFTYEFDGKEKTFDSLIYKLTDKLKRRFGNDVSWDVSSSCHQM